LCLCIFLYHLSVEVDGLEYILNCFFVEDDFVLGF